MKTLALFYLFGTLLYSASFDYLVTKDTLKQELYKKFPIEKKTLLTSIVLSEPQLELKNSRVLLHLKVSLPRLLDDNQQPLQTEVQLSSGVKFVAPSKLFLQDIEIENIKKIPLQKEQKELMLLSLNMALNSYFKDHVAYTIDYENIKNNIAKMAASYLTKIDIQSEGINLHFEF